MNATKVLVTGAAGFIGFHLSKKLLNENLIVIGVDNLNDYYDVELKNSRLNILSKYDDFYFIKADIANKESLDQIFNKYNPEIVINLAAQAGVRYSIDNPQVYIESNLIGFYNVLECCRSHLIKHLLFASSSSVYGNQKKTPFSIEDKTDEPISLYAATKKSNELLAHSYSHLYDIPMTGLRFFTVYGPYGRPDMAYYGFSNKIVKGDPIKIFNDGDMYRDFTYIDDIVSAIQKMIMHCPKENSNGDKFKVYNIGNNRPVKLMTFITELEKCFGKVAVKEYLPMQPGDVYQTYADIEDLKNDFNFQPSTSIEEGLKQFSDWYKEYYNI